MARLFRARLKEGADPGAVHRRTGVLLWGDWKPLSEYNLGPLRTDILFADPDVEIEMGEGADVPGTAPDITQDAGGRVSAKEKEGDE
ncbi:MAG: hypothetical protein FJ280_21365 [Planctomycetes bacterium]|nr:hypothetical protein [Planctomycetota bacterium]